MSMDLASDAKRSQPSVSSAHDSRAVLILGMHRSGTSAVTRCLNLMGVDLGNELLPAVEGNNTKGFWESAEVVAVHESLLAALGRSWCDARPLPKTWLASKAAQEAAVRIADLIQAGFGNSTLWAVKDPRLCRFVPLWRKVLADLGIHASALLVVRHPAEVAGSLKRRDGLPEELSQLAWLEHFAEAEVGSRGLPRSIVSYDGLLSDWRGELTRAAADMDIDWPISMTEAERAVAAFLDRGERHHQATTEPGAVPNVEIRLYCLCRAFKSKAEDWAEISGLVDSYFQMAPAFLNRTETLLKDLDDAKRKGANLERVMDDSLTALEQAVGRTVMTRGSSTADDQATLYYRSGQTYDESRACVVRVEWDTLPESTLRFGLPAIEGLVALRFDPSQRAGAFVVQNVQIDGVPISDLRQRIRGAHQSVLAPEAVNGITFMSNDADPWIEFDVRDLIRTRKSLAIEIDCERQTLNGKMGIGVMSTLLAATSGKMEQRIQSSISESFSVVAQQLSSMQQRGAERERELTAARERESALQGRHAELEQELAATREHESALQARHAELEREVAAGGEREARFRQEAFWLAGSTAELRAALDAKQHALGKAHDALDEKQAELDAMQMANCDLAGRHVTAERELAEIKSSTIWRALLMLRSFLFHVPGDMRLTLRRMMKAGWWLVTPWRMPARIRFLRRRRELPYSHRQASGRSPTDTVTGKSGDVR